MGLLGLALLGGCGVSLQDEAQSLPEGAIPTLSESAQATPTSPESPLFFVVGRELEPVERPIADLTAVAVMSGLAAGPPASRSDELRTLLVDPLTGPMLVVTSIGPDNQVNLATTPAFFQVPPNDQILMLGQAVLSLDEIGLAQALITDPTGDTMGVPLPNGTVRVGPVMAKDFMELIRE